MELWEFDFRLATSAPDVSVVICVHGKIEFTLQCLVALHRTRHSNRSSFELIVVDDASPDHSRDVLRSIRGLQLVELDYNVGFLRAANHGVRAARGRHVLFLNNDTEPIGNWLDPLVERIDANEKVFVAGSKLVYPDGTLQEAGGAIFNDASGWNFGRGGEAQHHASMYARPVDYVSGASLIVRGDFVRSQSGFDERYAPAYYEDTDLCFAARAAGGEVWFEPESLIVHHEGISHGTHTSTGIKAYQLKNQLKFREKWAVELAQQPAPGNINLGRERCRSGRVVVIDNEIPTPDQDSGSFRLFQVMLAMRDLGFGVVFLPLNGLRLQPYERQLQAAGIHVLTDEEGQAWTYLADQIAVITHFWVSRPQVLEAVLDRIRALPERRPLIYDTVDLHHLRLEREAELADDVDLLEQAYSMADLELRLMEEADQVVVVSEYELNHLRGRTTTELALVPNVHPGTLHLTSPIGRQGLLFVGGFRHKPNVDAVLWLCNDILPLVHRVHPDAVLTIVGSHLPAEIAALESPNVRIGGWVQNLEPLLRTSRVSVAPLRFGAGAKGKVGEAMAAGLPVVGTRIATEGMRIEAGVHALVADDPQGFADAICVLLEDNNRWQEIAAGGMRHIIESAGEAACRRYVAKVLTESEEGRWASTSLECIAPEQVR